MKSLEVNTRQMLNSEILCREGYKMFRGEMVITFENPNLKPFI